MTDLPRIREALNRIEQHGNVDDAWVLSQLNLAHWTLRNLESYLANRTRLPSLNPPEPSHHRGEVRTR